ncbi:MAG: hypothetical protein K2W96_17920, partial [Gemmataceae bacterium]|nr:hypothetical protein [Gemmataceae bacterium]
MIRWMPVPLLLLAGCGPSMPPVPDAAKAKEALAAALDGWKAGEKPLTWNGKDVDLKDGRFKKGAKLLSY